MIDLLLGLIDVARNWRFWAWFGPGCVFALIAFHVSDIAAVSWAGAVGLLVYFGWRGYRAEREAGGER